MSNVEVIDKTLDVMEYTADKLVNRMHCDTEAEGRALAATIAAAVVQGLLAAGLLDMEDD